MHVNQSHATLSFRYLLYTINSSFDSCFHPENSQESGISSTNISSTVPFSSVNSSCCLLLLITVILFPFLLLYLSSAHILDIMTPFKAWFNARRCRLMTWPMDRSVLTVLEPDQLATDQI
jgi:hypothetical protein